MIKLILISLLYLSAAFARNDKGNGGDAIVCRAPIYKYIQSAELFDYYEARELRGLNLAIKTAFTLEEKTLYYAKKIAYFSAMNNDKLFYNMGEEAAKLVKAFENFDRGILMSYEVRFTNNILTDIPDSDSLSIPAGCEIEQLAIRLNKRFEEDPQYLIQADIFKILDPDQRAGLILHELIYKGFTLRYKHTNSIAARYFHQFLLLESAEELTFVKYKQYLAKSKIRRF